MSSKTKSREEAGEFIQDIYAVISFTSAIFLLLALFTDKTGIVGTYLAEALAWLLGWGRYLLPFSLLVLGALLTSHVKREWETTLEGAVLVGLSILAFSHIMIPLEKMFEKEALFSHGGFLGFILAYPLVWLVKPVGAGVIIGGLFFTGLVLTFRAPLREIISPLLLLFKSTEPPPLKEGTPLALPFEEEEVPEPTQVLEETSTEEETVKISLSSQSPKPKEKEELVSPLEVIRQKKKIDMFFHTSPAKKKKTAHEMKSAVEKTLRDFGIPARIVNSIRGPTVTRFEVQLERGVKVNRLLAIEEDIALALASPDVRILAPIPGKSAIGIEVPNRHRSFVYLGDIVKEPEFQNFKSPLGVAIGKDITGESVIIDLRDLPHLLIAGATGSGKSVNLNAVIVSILLRALPTEAKMIFIDPKRIELNVFEGLPHLVVPVVTNPKQAAAALAWSVEEMERRFDLLSQAKVRNIAAYHSQIKKSLPYLIIIIDELADLMMIAPREVEDSICRLAQLGRAVGIHLIVATQRPSSDIITGLIKSNITSRIAFAVSSQVDSRVILDTPGAEKLVGKGDMLFSTPRWLKPRRLQGAYITEAEIERVVNFWREQEQPAYDMEVLETRRLQTVLEDYEDELLEQAAELVIKNKQASVSYLQRKLRLGYARAARLMDMLEEKGIVGPHQGSKPRKVLLSWEEWENIRTWPRRGEH